MPAVESKGDESRRGTSGTNRIPPDNHKSFIMPFRHHSHADLRLYAARLPPQASFRGIYGRLDPWIEG